jgi:hypothetical protein
MVNRITLDRDIKKTHNRVFRDRKELFSQDAQLTCGDVLYDSDYFGPALEKK